MFEELNRELLDAKERLRRKRKLEGMVLQTRQALQKELEQKNKLEAVLRDEDEDVKKLESLSITGLFYTILGSRQQQLDKERQEQLAARLKYEAGCSSLAGLERELAAYEADLKSLFNADSEYETAMKRKEELILRSDDSGTQKLFQLTDKAADLESRQKEVQEAIVSGQNAQSELRKVIKSLESAKDWGTWDMMGGGFLATAAKHSRIDEAKEYAYGARIALSMFQRELSDVDLAVNMEVNIGSFETFADYFLDGLISDWVVQSRIRDSLGSVQSVLESLNRVLFSLERKSDSIKQDLNTTKEDMRTLIEGV